MKLTGRSCLSLPGLAVASHACPCCLQDGNKFVEPAEFRQAFGAQSSLGPDGGAAVLNRIAARADMLGDGNHRLDEVEFPDAMNNVLTLLTE